MPEFFQTPMGKRFYEGTMPRIARALERIADALEKEDDLPDNRLWTLPDAAKYLQVAESTLYVWVSRKTIPYVKVGRKTHFRKADLDKWVEKNAVKARDW